MEEKKKESFIQADNGEAKCVITGCALCTRALPVTTPNSRHNSGDITQTG